MKFGWKGLLGIAVTAVCLYLAFSKTDWSSALEQAKRANYFLLILGAVAATGMFPLRALRWRTILDPVAPNLPLGPLWRSIAVGMMVNNVAVLRAGELARVFALTRERPEVSFSTGLASLLVDRVFDTVVVLLLLTVSVVAGGFSATTQIHGYSLSRLATVVAFGSLAMLFVLYALVFFPEALIRVFELFARKVSPAIEQRGGEMLRRFASGLSVLRSPGHFAAVFLWTLAHWLLQPLAFWLSLRAFGIVVPLAATLFIQGVIVILVALPGAPGFFGQFELGATIGLGVYGIAASSALTWALVFHVASFIPITLIGAYYSTRLGLSMGEIKTAGAEQA
jgi:glycosyltransferase 2 family protein